jgi:hypothetical protein
MWRPNAEYREHAMARSEALHQTSPSLSSSYFTGTPPCGISRRAAVAAIRGLVRSMPPHRVFLPDSDILGRAALLSGMLCRLQGYANARKLRALQDCVLFSQAQRLGFTVLIANIRDFDVLLQLLPAGRVLFYRRR